MKCKNRLGRRERQDDQHEQSPQCRQVAHKLLGLWTDFVPNWVELPADDNIEIAEVYVFDNEVVKVELSSVCLEGRVTFVKELPLNLSASVPITWWSCIE